MINKQTNTKQNLNIERVLDKDNENLVKVTETYTEPRYIGRILSGWITQEYCQEVINQITNDCKITILVSDRDGFKSTLHNFDIDDEELTRNNLEEDLKRFQAIIDVEFGKGKYECQALVAYIHGTIAFSINSSGKGCCPWDSGCIGFIAIPIDDSDKLYNTSRVADISKDLTSAWNGGYYDYQVYDNLTQEVVDSITITSYSDDKEWMEQQKKDYRINFFDIEPTYE